jgi:YD repeat-containing protein
MEVSVPTIAHICVDGGKAGTQESNLTFLRSRHKQQAARFSYDNAGSRTDVYYQDSTSEHLTYNLLGQLLKSTDNLAVRTYFYNNQGLLTAVSNAFGVERGIGYDIYDHPTNVTSADRVVVTQTFDLLGRLLARTYPDSGVERFEYGYYGLTAYTNQLTKVTRFA